MSGRMMVATAAVIASVLVAGMTYGFAASLGPVEPEQLTVFRPSETPSPTPAPSASPSPSPSPTASPSPSPSASPTPAECTVMADADSWIDQSATGANNGTAPTLTVRSQNQNRNARAFVSFDLSVCGISSGATVSNAVLRLHTTAPSNATRTIEVRRVTGTWAESTIAWANQPSIAGTATDSQANTAGPIEWDVADDVTAFVDVAPTPNHGWAVLDSNENQAASGFANTFASREHATVANRPSLTITWMP